MAKRSGGGVGRPRPHASDWSLMDTSMNVDPPAGEDHPGRDQMVPQELGRDPLGYLPSGTGKRHGPKVEE